MTQRCFYSLNLINDPVSCCTRSSESCRGEEMIPRHPGPGGEDGGEADAEGGRRAGGGGGGGGGLWRGEGGVNSVCGWIRLGCVECQLIMSLLLTPYVEFFMLSLTSRLNTDKF